MFSLSFKKISGFLGTCAMATVRVHVCIYVCMYEVSHVCFFHGKRCSMLVRATSSCGVLLLSHLGKGRRHCRGGTGIFMFSLHSHVHSMGLKLCPTLSVLNILLRMLFRPLPLFLLQDWISVCQSSDCLLHSLSLDFVIWLSDSNTTLLSLFC